MTSLIILMLVCVLWAYLRWRRKYSDAKRPPIYPGAWPVLGHIIPLISGRKRIWNFVRQAAVDISRSGGVATLLVGPVEIYVVCDPEDALQISNQFMDKSHHYDLIKSWFGDGLITSNSRIWKNDRKLLMPAFSHDVLVNFLESLNKEARTAVDRLSTTIDEKDFDHVPYIKKYAVDTLCSSVLGIDFSEKQKYMHTAEFLLDVFLKRAINILLQVNFIYKWTNLKKEQDESMKFVNGVADNMIKMKRERAKEEYLYKTGAKKNFLELILQLQLTGGENVAKADLNDIRIRDHLNTVLTTGVDSISSIMPIILVLIGSHDMVQEKIWKEIKDIFDDTSRDITKDDLQRLVYLEAVIKESMRLFTPIPLVARKLEEDVKLKNYNLSAGKTCVLLLAGLNLHPIWGDDVQQFKPDRWLHPSTLPDHPAAFAAFSIGRRNCIGKYYAMMSMKILLVHILRNYVISANWKKMELTEDVILRVDSGHHISLKRRS